MSVSACRAKDSYAQLASAWRLVQVQQQYAVTFTLPLTLSAANVTAAQAQTDILTTSSNTTEALAAAVAAGLISGDWHASTHPGFDDVLQARCSALMTATTHVSWPLGVKQMYWLMLACRPCCAAASDLAQPRLYSSASTRIWLYLMTCIACLLLLWASAY